MAEGGGLIDLSDRSRLERAINGALRATIHDHGPITVHTLSSASKRVVGALKTFNRQTLERAMTSVTDPNRYADTEFRAKARASVTFLGEPGATEMRAAISRPISSHSTWSM